MRRATSAPPDGTALYFALALGITSLALAAPVLAAAGLLEGEPEEYFALAPVAIFGPALAALVASAREGGWPQARALLAGLRPPRRSPFWYALALTLPGLVYLVGRAIYGLFADEDLPWVYGPETTEQILALFLVPIGEEIGWRGYALPRLQRRYGALRASVILGALWALWHLPMFISVGIDVPQLVFALPYFLAGSVLFTWFYNRTGASLSLAVLLHVGTHLDSPKDGTGFVVSAFAYVGLAVLLVALDREAFPGPAKAAPPPA